MMKQVLCTVFVSSVIFSQASPILAISIEQVPNPRRTNATWVSDTANILSSDTETRLNRMISELEAKNGSEIAVVTVPETAPSASPKEFATKLFNHWGIGKRGKNNGVLFLISKGDRRVEIETGTGLVTVLPNSKVSSITALTAVMRYNSSN
ncbi:MAG: TPM domain-containing protein [Scytonematopsis contorta HA4267-MV1]|jgi:uncharacterized protein|nr:TPM domain-containing protein [Scytonematopsis contorta HA4267-MV1]